MPIQPRDDEDLDQVRPEQGEAEHDYVTFAGPAEAATAASKGAKAAAAPAAGGAKATLAPRVNILTPTPHGKYQEGMEPISFEVFGEPHTTVVLYWSVYAKGKVVEDKQTTIAFGAESQVIVTTFTEIEGNQHYAMHARAQSAAGVFSPVHVVEYQGPPKIETHGGGV